MAYSVSDTAIILKGTRHGLLASVREDADWRDVVSELRSLTTHNAEFLDRAQLVLDFGWREVSGEQFDALLDVLKIQGLGCSGILSTSLNTRNIAEARGYRAIIGRLGLAQHQGRRLRRDQLANQAAAQGPIEVPTVAAPPEPVVAAIPAALVLEPSALPTVSIVETAPAFVAEVVSVGAPPTHTGLDHEESSAVTSGSDLADPLEPSPEPSLEEDRPCSAFDSADPMVAALPVAFDSSELDGHRVFSSSHEPGIHVPHFQDEEPTLYIRKTLRSGQRVVFAGNVILLGDLNPGAQIEADGDVIVLGQLRGSVHAGCEGDEEATVITSSFRATQLRIADRFFQAETGNRFFKKSPLTGTLRARLDGETVVVEALPVR